MPKKYLGVDIGGTTVKAGIVNGKGIIEKKYSISVNDLRVGDFKTNLIKWLEERIKEHQIHSVGFGIPGLISMDCSEMLEVPNLSEIEGKEFVSALKRYFPLVQFYFANDANAAALGACRFGNEKENQTFGFITLGTGIGSAVIINGQIYTGQNGNGPEVGMLPLGNANILENSIGKVGLIKMAEKHYTKLYNSEIVPEAYQTTKGLFENAGNGDDVAVAVFREAGNMLGHGLAIFILMFDLKTIFIGGGISPCLKFMKNSTDVVLQEILTPYYLNGLSIKEIKLGNDAGILGAAALCI